MKNPALSLWLSSFNWWMGHATHAVRRQQRVARNEMTTSMKAVPGKPKRKRRRTVRRKTV
ncbi:hypothetical protein [Methylorubrum populi]|uniref:hypothetical protein n=1 Tax=Methylorubrum populi TaxID=223967 RepID=UPI000AFD971C|nr:hypothetical protein [Methylorubrum populi]